ncbi:MAG: hypothetical protein ACRYGF_16135 [Janthinobacterium lividum]
MSATLLDLIAALIRLLQTRRLNRRDYFEKIIDPLYKDFVPVALDMLQMFRTARFNPAAFRVGTGLGKDLLNCYSPEDLEAARRTREKAAHKFLSELATAREANLDTRNQLRAMLTVCEEDLFETDKGDLAEFVQAMLWFFAPAADTRNSDSFQLVMLVSDEVMALYAWHAAMEAALRKGDARRAFVHSTLAGLERSWGEIARLYMKLKLEHTVAA